MSIKKFRPQDIITNTLRTHPSCEFFVADGHVYFNNIPQVSGTLSLGANVPVTSGYVSLYEMNVDRLSGSTNRFIGGKAEANEPYEYTLIDPGDGRDPIWVTGPGATPGGVSEPTQYAYSQTAAAGLKGWWKMAAISSNDKVTDATDNNRGTAPSGMVTTSVDGTVMVTFQDSNRAIEFNGEDDYINIGAATTWNKIIGDGTDGTSLMSFAIWIYREDGTEDSDPRLFQFGDSSGDSDTPYVYAAVQDYSGRIYFSTGWDTGDKQGEWRTDSWSSSDPTRGPIDTDTPTWTHVVITYDATDAANDPILYINGELFSWDTESETPEGSWLGIGNDDCFIGSAQGGGGEENTWFGLLAQFSVWNVILTPEDVLALYEASKGEVYTTYGGFIPSKIIDNNLIYPYVTKDGTRVSLNNVTTGSSYDLDFQYGDIISGSYPLSASIKRELIGWYPAANGANTAILPLIGPYRDDEAGGSRGAGELDTGYPYMLPAGGLPAGWDTDDVDAALPKGDDSSEKCGDRNPLATDGYGSGFPFNDGFFDHYWALKNTLKNNVYLSPHYAVTGATSQYSTPEWIKDQQMINMISIPSIFYGSKIKPGSVSLKWYLTGTLIGELQDTKQNGELIEVTGNNPYLPSLSSVGNVAGVVLYKEGFILLTGSWALDENKGAWNESTKTYTGGMITIRSGSGNTPYSPMWIDWGAGTNDNCNKLTTSVSGSTAASPTTPAVAASNNLESASFGLSFKGTSDTQVLTMFANAKRGEANFSNNPTYLSHTASVTSSFTTSSYAYIEDPDRLVYSFVSSSAMDHSASYKREVYISRIGIYDENKNLIGVATMSNPVRKEEDQDLTFKLKLDI